MQSAELSPCCMLLRMQSAGFSPGCMLLLSPGCMLLRKLSAAAKETTHSAALG